MNLKAVRAYDKGTFSLTAFLDGFVTPVRTVSNLVAHFAHLDALPAATLELVWSTALSHCYTHKGQQLIQYQVNYNQMVFFSL